MTYDRCPICGAKLIPYVDVGGFTCSSAPRADHLFEYSTDYSYCRWRSSDGLDFWLKEFKGTIKVSMEEEPWFYYPSEYDLASGRELLEERIKLLASFQ